MFLCHVIISLPGKGFPVREGFLIQGKAPFQGRIPSQKRSCTITRAYHKIGKLFPYRVNISLTGKRFYDYNWIIIWSKFVENVRAIFREEFSQIK